MLQFAVFAVVLGLSIASPIQVKDDTNCDAPDQFFKGKCYHFELSRNDFADAAAKCKSISHDLVTIFDQKEQNYLNFNSNPASIWIGIHLVNGNWQWNSNGQVVKPTFTNWENRVAPNDPAKACAVLDGGKNGIWRAVDCSERNFSICETAATSSPKRV